MIRIVLILVVVCSAILAVIMFRPHSHVNLLRQSGEALTDWQWQQKGESSGGVTLDVPAVRCDILKADGVGWHMCLYQARAILKSGHNYHLRFTAKSDRDMTVPIASSVNHQDYHSVGLYKLATLTPLWKQYDYDFKAEQADANLAARIPTFVLGSSIGVVWIKDMVLEEN